MVKRMLAILLALVLCVGYLAGILWVLGTNAPLMLQLMRKEAPPENTWLPAEDYPGVVDVITGYLRGEVEEFQYVFEKNGGEYLAFQPHEQQHMADCLALFRLDKTLGLVCGALALALIVLLWRSRGDKRVFRCFLGGLAGLVALIVLLGVWAVVDFDSLFVLFHHISFTNDLWLLNPYTDLLLRLMPTSFFIHYATILIIAWLVMLGLTGTAAWLIHRQSR